MRVHKHILQVKTWLYFYQPTELKDAVNRKCLLHQILGIHWRLDLTISF